MRSLPVDVVRAFLAIVDRRGFTRAAEYLGRTQPTISLQIRRLEELVGGAVFDSTSYLHLTPLGEVVLEYGRQFVQSHDDLAAALKACDEDPALSLEQDVGEFSTFLQTPALDTAH